MFVVGALVATTASASQKDKGGYVVHKLVSDKAGVADHMDANLVKSWGITASSTSPWWVADSGANVSTPYDGNGVARFPPTPLVSLSTAARRAPSSTAAPASWSATGNGHSGRSVFMFATEGGTIRGWNPAGPPPPRSTQSLVVVDRTGEGAVFKGLAIAGDRL